MANYSHMPRNTNAAFASGGYKNVFFFAPVASFLSLKNPISPVVNIGDELIISAAHTFTAPAGFYEYSCTTHSVTLTAATVGDDGAKELEWTAKFQILGDSASTQAQLQRQLNDDLICLLKDSECGANQYVQLGDDCNSPEFSVSFDGKTTKEGKKQYTVEVKSKKKSFYNYTITKAA